jgi:cyclase
MELLEVYAGVVAVIRPELGANVGLVHTSEGIVVLDTTSYPADMQQVLRAAKVRAEDVRLVVNTHYHSDHTWGNQLFNCPILAHRLCQQRMQAMLESEWQAHKIEAHIAEIERSDPRQAYTLREKVSGLRITLPNQVFDRWFSADLGSVRVELTHQGAHTSDLAVAWLPEARVLFASDLIFIGRYPYLEDADVPGWIEALNKLNEFNATLIVPGHGPVCQQCDLQALAEYLERTWALTADHLSKGHALSETLADPAYPRYVEGEQEHFERNICAMYQQLERGMRMVL